ncbi:hypothetical protein Tco_1558953, partial [Tanacetum coccineum]
EKRLELALDTSTPPEFSRGEKDVGLYRHMDQMVVWTIASKKLQNFSSREVLSAK